MKEMNARFIWHYKNPSATGPKKITNIIKNQAIKTTERKREGERERDK